jgi:hypothetical protein
MSTENFSDPSFDSENYEEITSEEVDRVVEELERLMESVTSENIKSHLEDAINSIFFLVYDDEEATDVNDAA